MKKVFIVYDMNADIFDLKLRDIKATIEAESYDDFKKKYYCDSSYGTIVLKKEKFLGFVIRMSGELEKYKDRVRKMKLIAENIISHK